MSTIQLEKIVYNGYRFMSIDEFDAAASYIKGMTYLLYDRTRDSEVPKLTTGTSERYMIRADRCVYVDHDGYRHEVTEVTDSSGNVLYTYSNPVELNVGTYSSSVVNIPVGIKYLGQIPSLPNTVNRVFIGWYRNGIKVTDDTIVKRGDVLNAKFSIAGVNTHPFGVLFAATGKWETSSNGHDMTYRATYAHGPSHMKFSVEAHYDYANDSITRSYPVVSWYNMSDANHSRVKEVLGRIHPVCINSGTKYRWYSHYGWQADLDIGQSSNCELTFTGIPDGLNMNSEGNYTNFHTTVFVFAPGDFSGSEHNTTICLGPGDGRISVLQPDMTERLFTENTYTNGNSNLPSQSNWIGDQGHVSQGTKYVIHWNSSDTGVVIFRGDWDYIGLSNYYNDVSANDNYTNRPLISVPIYAATSFPDYGFDFASGRDLDIFGVRKNITVKCPNDDYVSPFKSDGIIHAIMFAEKPTFSSQCCSFLDVRTELIYIEEMDDVDPAYGVGIWSSWADGVSYPSNDGKVICIINNAENTAGLCISSAVTFDLFEIRNCNSISAVGSLSDSDKSVSTFLPGKNPADTVCIGGSPVLKALSFPALTCDIVMSGMDVYDIQNAAGTSGWGAESGARFIDKRGLGYTFAKTGTEEISYIGEL